MTSAIFQPNGTTKNDATQIQDDAHMETNLYDIVNQNLTSVKYYYVEESKFVEVVCVLVLIIGLVGNILGICVFRCQFKTKNPLVLDKIISYLFSTGLFTTLLTAPLHLYASRTNMFPADASLCQLQGLLLNFFFLLCLWYTAVMATERFFRIVSPHEHRLTFSPLNLNVILAGVFVLLVVEVSGPIYGWAEYGFLDDCRVCLLNPSANHILTYSVIYVACYVTLPVGTTFGFCGYVILSGLRRNERLSNGSQVLKSRKGIIILCSSMIVTTVLLLPYHVTLLMQAMLFPVTIQQKLICYWLHICGITCSYPIILIIFGRREIFPVIKHFFELKTKNFIVRKFSRLRKSEGKTPNSDVLTDIEHKRSDEGGKPVELLDNSVHRSSHQDFERIKNEASVN